MKQIAILNGASIFGRTMLNMLADRVGPLNVLWPVATVTAALMFVMFSVTSTAATIIFSIFYGFFSGARAFHCFVSYHCPLADGSHGCSDLNDAAHGITLRERPTRDWVGVALSTSSVLRLIYFCLGRLRLGLAFFSSSFALLTGTPIAGALYDSGGHWYRPIVFSAVRVFLTANWP